MNIGTCDFEGRPNVAPKLLLSIEDDSLYLVDYVMGRTWGNLKVNPRMSIATMNVKTLIGYQFIGSVEIIQEGAEYEKKLEQLHEMEIRFSTERIIEGIHAERKHDNFEIGFPDKVAIFKVNVQEIAEISQSGSIKRKNTYEPEYNL